MLLALAVGVDIDMGLWYVASDSKFMPPSNKPTGVAAC